MAEPLRVLISSTYFGEVAHQYEAQFREQGIEIVRAQVVERLEEAALLEAAKDVDGVICGDDRFTARVLRGCPRLKVIAKWGTGIDGIDREEAKRLGIAVLNTPNAFTEPVADVTLGFMLAFARQIPWMDRALHEGRWEKRPCVTLRECVLGIVGVGNIGRAVATRAAAFGMRVLGCDPIQPPADVLAATGLAMVSQDQLLAQADFISLSCDLNPTSFHLIGERQLALMKPSAVLINTARGAIVDEPALIRALQERRIAGAGLDVFEHEPLPAESPLRSMDNCLLAPHHENSSPTAARHVHDNTVRNLLSALRAASAIA